MSGYRVFWMKRLPPPESGLDVVPCLVSSERFDAFARSMQTGDSFRYSNLDFALGIASVLWQSDESLERPRDLLLREMRSMMEAGNFDNDEEMIVQLATHLVETYGPGSALEVTLSGVEICPQSFGINHDLSMETLAAMQSGRWQELGDSVKGGVLRALRKAADRVPVENFKKNTYTAYLVTALYALACIAAGERQRAAALIGAARAKVPLNDDLVSSAEQLLQCPSEEAQQGLDYIALTLQQG
jgi:hypothetical protein